MSESAAQTLQVRIELMSVLDISAATQLYQQSFAAAPWGEAYADSEMVARYLSHFAQPLYDAWPQIKPLEIEVKPPRNIFDPSAALEDTSSVKTQAQNTGAQEDALMQGSAHLEQAHIHNYSGLLPFFAFVARTQDQMVALCCGSLKPWMEGMHALIDEFCVAPAYQGRGLGRAFLQGIEQILALRGINAMVTMTDPLYQGGHFYRKCGYVAIHNQVALAKVLS